MVRGISFKIPNVYDKVLSSILKGIQYELYSWIISEDEVLISMKQGYLFEDKRLEGKDFEIEIERKTYMPFFINLQAYPAGKDRSKINSYEDFKKSHCEFVVLIWDCIYVDVYIKNSNVIELIKHNAEEKVFNDIEYITDENDCRTRMSVL